MERVVVLGAGYAGLRAVLDLDRLFRPEEAHLLLVNKHDYHQFITQLHESAAGRERDVDARIPLGEVLRGRQVVLRKGTVTALERRQRLVRLEDGEEPYDYLIAALGSLPEFFDIPGLAEHSFTLRSLNTARLVRAHIEQAFARSKNDPVHKEGWLTVMVGGAGLTGVEVAAELADWLPGLCRRYDVRREDVRLVCVEAAPDILPGMDEAAVRYARKVLEEKGVRLLTGMPVAGVGAEAVKLKGGQVIPCRTVIWAGGIRGNPVLAEAGLSTLARGRVIVNRFLQAVDDPRIFVTGDCALVTDPASGRPLAPNAQLAIQQGRTAAWNVYALVKGLDMRPYRPEQLGLLVSLGRGRGVGVVRKVRARGLTAALAKEMVPLKYLYSLGGPRLLVRQLL